MSLKTILIIDDDRNLRQSMALILRRADYSVDTAGSAAEALRALDASEYDLAVLDLMMPDEDSILLPKLMELHPCLSILVLSAQANLDPSVDARYRREDCFLTKPVTPEALLQRVKMILDSKSCSSEGLN